MEPTATGVRVVCRVPNASNLINGVRFGAAGEGVMVSEPVSDEVAASFCRNTDFSVDRLPDDVLAAVDDDIARSALAAAPPTDASDGADARLVEELRQANAAQAADNDRLQVENAELKLKLSKGTAQEVDRLTAEIADLRARGGGEDVRKLRAEIEAGRATLEEERRAHAEERKRLEDELALARENVEQLKKAAEATDGSVKEKGGKGGGKAS